MAYSDYLHCWECHEKAVYWVQWDWIGCAHCEGDLERAERGVVRVYCTDCTAKMDDREPKGGRLPKRVKVADVVDARVYPPWVFGMKDVLRVRLRSRGEYLTITYRRRSLDIPSHMWEALRDAVRQAQDGLLERKESRL